MHLVIFGYICSRCQTILNATERGQTRSAGKGESLCPIFLAEPDALNGLNALGKYGRYT